MPWGLAATSARLAAALNLQVVKYLPVQLKGDHGVITMVIDHYDQFLLSSEITEGMQHLIIKIYRDTNKVADRQ